MITFGSYYSNLWRDIRFSSNKSPLYRNNYPRTCDEIHLCPWTVRSSFESENLRRLYRSPNVVLLDFKNTA